MDTQKNAPISVANEQASIPILPYSLIVGQERLKLALELAYIAPRIGGVLISGQRGTGKSTAVRGFAQMIYKHLPITLPINATEDRVVGGWCIDELMKSHPVPQAGLLEEANGKLLYVDEVNLLDDHLVNIILDVTSTGVLVVQREGKSEEKYLSFTLVGTMNPEEGGLRPQLLDRFGLMVEVKAETKPKNRIAILQTVLQFDEALSWLKAGQSLEEIPYLKEAIEEDRKRKAILETARQNVYQVKVSDSMVEKCVQLASNPEFKAEGNRGDYIMALAARAAAALEQAEANGVKEKATEVKNEHIAKVARLVLQHRRPESEQMAWRDEDDQRIIDILSRD